MAPIKIIKGVALLSFLVSAIALIQELHTVQVLGWVSRNGDIYNLLFRVAVFSYAATWLGALIFKMRIAVLLTSTVLLSPAAMIGYNMIAIWFEEKDTMLDTWITMCLGVCLVLYLRIVWHWWTSKRTLVQP